MKSDIITGCLGFLGAVALVAAIEILGAYLVQWAWNLLVPSLLHGPSITYPMALALCVVVSLASSTLRSIVAPSSKD